MEDIVKRGKSFARSMMKSVGLRASNTVKIVNTPIAYVAQGTEVTYLMSEANDTYAAPLPNTLIIKPGNYTFKNKCYTLIREGLYRFVLPEKDNEQRIVYVNDAAALMSSIAWMVAHGEGDDLLPSHDLMEKAKQHKLSLTCESVSKFALALLTALKVKSRVIGTRTLDQLNTYDCGHYLIEVFREDLGKWVLYDLDSDACFSYQGQLMSLLEFMDHLDENYQIISISADVKMVAAGSSAKNYDFTFLNEGRLANLKQWYKRVMQLAFIIEKDEHFSFCTNMPEKADGYPRGYFPAIKYISRETFIKKYYQ